MPPNQFEIKSGSAVQAEWHPKGQKKVEPIDVIVLHPDRKGHVFVAEHSEFQSRLEIISAVAEILPGAIIGLLERSYTKEEVFAFLRNGGDVPITRPVPAALDAEASTWLGIGLNDNARLTITKL